ncbi:MAG: hypothetical protein DRN15_00790 [Thermoprotei archaeon]|nr:MAG: hypothetical protein DRM97_04040 [Thermoprotei archaeon]RLF25222.1 MAG: hypothetical protein DRN15_00790 [Thermoprotei archaeon]
MNVDETLIERIRRTLEELLRDARGVINSAALVSSEGLPIAHILPSDSEPEAFSAAVMAMINAIDSSLEMLGEKGKKILRVDVMLEGGGHLIAVPMEMGALVCQTARNPNLGLVYLVLRKYEERVRDLIR